MADKTIPDYSAAGSIDASVDYLLLYQNSTNSYKKINRNTLLGGSGTPVDTTSTQTLQNKVLDNTTTLTIKDNLFTIQDGASTTKQAQFQLSSITAGQTRTLTIPDADLTIVGTATTQTLTNKTLTAPVITNGSITGTTITTDAITGQTSANSGTIYGLSVTSAKISGTSITNATITTSQIANDTITGANINWAQTGADGIWWEELGRTTLGSAGSTITLSGLPAKKYLKLLISVVASGGAVGLVQVKLNNDSGANYSRRTSTDGAADATAVSSTVFLNNTGPASGSIFQSVTDIINLTSYAKLGMTLAISDATTGAGTAPTSNITFTKWVNTVSQINRVDVTASTNNFAIGSEVIVLGHD